MAAAQRVILTLRKIPIEVVAFEIAESVMLNGKLNVGSVAHEQTESGGGAAGAWLRRLLLWGLSLAALPTSPALERYIAWRILFLWVLRVQMGTQGDSGRFSALEQVSRPAPQSGNWLAD